MKQLREIESRVVAANRNYHTGCWEKFVTLCEETFGAPSYQLPDKWVGPEFERLVDQLIEEFKGE